MKFGDLRPGDFFVLQSNEGEEVDVAGLWLYTVIEPVMAWHFQTVSGKTRVALRIGRGELVHFEVEREVLQVHVKDPGFVAIHV